MLSEVKRPTVPESEAAEIVRRLGKTVRQASNEAGVPAKKVIAVGIGAPAPVDPRTGFVFHAPNLPSLRDFPLGERLSGVLGIPVYVDNDVNVGTVGEHVLGAGRGTKDMVGIFVGTGVGGGVIVNGRLRHGFRNSAGEVGHMVVGFKNQADESTCGCGRPGCLEAYASRTAIEREIRAAMAAGRDPLVVEILERVTTYLAALVASVVNFFDPEMIVIGGGVAEALGEQLVNPIRRDAPHWYIQKNDADKVRIVAAELGDYAGVLGAATIARQNLP